MVREATEVVEDGPGSGQLGVEAAPGGFYVVEVGAGPAAHPVDDGARGLTSLGEAVVDAGWDLGMDRAVHQAVALQVAQGLGEHLVADALDPGVEFGEAQGPLRGR